MRPFNICLAVVFSVLVLTLQSAAQNKVVVIPLIGTEPTGDVQAEDVLEGVTFSNSSGAGLVGTMPNIGYMDIIPSTLEQTISEGYHDGSGRVAGDADLVSKNIKSGVSIFGVEGELHGGCTCAGTLNGTRWCDNGDGTVTDLSTCLVWLQKADWGGLFAFWVDTPYGVNAHDRAAQLYDGAIPDDGGLSDGSVEGDWRLPTRNELYDLANGTEPVRSGSMRAFTGVQSSLYWSSTTYVGATNLAWGVTLFDGNVNVGSKDAGHYVWPVRGGN